ncbi:MAG: hypothetical protein IPI67_26770 [Myxococcales bacterium]|nr:hypothetical protein [Myxococcales bacterium]
MAWVSDSWTSTAYTGLTLRQAFSGFPKPAGAALLRWAGYFAAKGSPDCYLASSVLSEALALAKWAAARAATVEHADWDAYRSLMLKELAATVRAYRASLRQLQEDAEWELGKHRAKELAVLERARHVHLLALVSNCRSETAHSRTQEFARKLRYRAAAPANAAATRTQHRSSSRRWVKVRYWDQQGVELPPHLSAWCDLANAITFVEQVYDLALECFADQRTRDFDWTDAYQVACRLQTGRINARRAAVEMAKAAGTYPAGASTPGLVRSAFSASTRWGVGLHDMQPTGGAGIRPGPLRIAAESQLPLTPIFSRACESTTARCTPLRVFPRTERCSATVPVCGFACPPGSGLRCQVQPG